MSESSPGAEDEDSECSGDGGDAVEEEEEWVPAPCTRELPFICQLWVETQQPELEGHTQASFPTPQAYAELTHTLLDHDKEHYLEIQLDISTTGERGLMQGSWNGGSCIPNIQE